MDVSSTDLWHFIKVFIIMFQLSQRKIKHFDTDNVKTSFDGNDWKHFDM